MKSNKVVCSYKLVLLALGSPAPWGDVQLYFQQESQLWIEIRVKTKQ